MKKIRVKSFKRKDNRQNLGNVYKHMNRGNNATENPSPLPIIVSAMQHADN